MFWQNNHGTNGCLPADMPGGCAFIDGIFIGFHVFVPMFAFLPIAVVVLPKFVGIVKALLELDTLFFNNELLEFEDKRIVVKLDQVFQGI